MSVVNRREFVEIASAGLLIVATAPLSDAQRGSGAGTFETRLHIGEDGFITVLSGKIEEGQKKGAELEEAKRNLDSLIHREAWIGDRLDQIEREKLNQAKGTINTCFPIFRLFCLSLLRETFLTMDEVWRIYTGFCAEKEISANPMRYREMLKPHVMMDDTETWKRINDWFPQG